MMIWPWLSIVALPFIAKFCLVILFPFSGLDKILHWRDALKQANSSFLPGGPVLLVAGMAVEFLTPVGILAGWHSRLCAFILAGFCVVTAVLYHQFWRCADFWSQGESTGRAHFWDFLKNFGLAGGLIFIIIGATAAIHPLTASLVQP